MAEPDDPAEPLDNIDISGRAVPDGDRHTEDPWALIGDRIVIVMCVDCSHSMHGAPIRELNATLRRLAREIKADDRMKWRAEILVVGFGGNVHVYDGRTGIRSGLEVAKAVTSFISGAEWKAPVLVAQGTAPMGAAVLAALELVERRKIFLRSQGVTYWRPWIWLVSDGQAQGEEKAFWKGVAQRARAGKGQTPHRIARGYDGCEYGEPCSIRFPTPTHHPERAFLESGFQASLPFSPGAAKAGHNGHGCGSLEDSLVKPPSLSGRVHPGGAAAAC